jgi:hypothetical protein
MSLEKRMLAGNAYAFETITVAATATTFTTTTWRVSPDSHTRAVVTATGGVMRYRYDGTAPTSTVGHLLSHGDMLIVEGSVNMANFKVIRAGSTSGSLSATYERV